MSDLSQAPLDGGLSSLSSKARSRREGAPQFAARVHAFVDTWKCLGPRCGKLLRPHESGRFFYCSDECRQASLEATRGRRGTAAP